MHNLVFLRNEDFCSNLNKYWIQQGNLWWGKEKKEEQKNELLETTMTSSQTHLRMLSPYHNQVMYADSDWLVIDSRIVGPRCKNQTKEKTMKKTWMRICMCICLYLTTTTTTTSTTVLATTVSSTSVSSSSLVTYLSICRAIRVLRSLRCISYNSRLAFFVQVSYS